MRILVCLDGSPRSPKVLATATELARRYEARLTLFRSVGIPAAMDGMNLEPEEGLMTHLCNEAQTYLDAQAKEIAPELVEARVVAIGTAWDAICTKAQEMRADLIVIGSHGYRGLDRVLGTTAAKVVNHATTDVLVVRAVEPR